MYPPTDTGTDRQAPNQSRSLIGTPITLHEKNLAIRLQMLIGRLNALAEEWGELGTGERKRSYYYAFCASELKRTLLKAIDDASHLFYEDVG
jgi:hypothetical protein